MSIFSNILDKLGLGKPAAKPAPTAPTARDSRPAPTTKPAATNRPVAAKPPVPAMPKPAMPKPVSGMQAPREAAYSRPAAPTTPAPMQMVDVVSKLDKLAANNPQELNWKVSIVDLLKLLGIDSSLTARKELAVELGCPPEKMGDSAQMNIWLHKTVLQKIAENGGNVPKDLLD